MKSDLLDRPAPVHATASRQNDAKFAPAGEVIPDEFLHTVPGAGPNRNRLHAEELHGEIRLISPPPWRILSLEEIILLVPVIVLTSILPTGGFFIALGVVFLVIMNRLLIARRLRHQPPVLIWQPKSRQVILPHLELKIPATDVVRLQVVVASQLLGEGEVQLQLIAWDLKKLRRHVLATGEMNTAKYYRVALSQLAKKCDLPIVQVRQGWLWLLPRVRPFQSVLMARLQGVGMFMAVAVTGMLVWVVLLTLLS